MKTKKTKGWTLSRTRYFQLLKFASKCVEALDGDMRYTSGEMNFVAVHGMVLGHILSQPWFIKMQRSVKRTAPREDLSVPNDWALEVATDATCDYPEDFTGEKTERARRKMLSAFTNLVQSRFLPLGFQLTEDWRSAVISMHEYKTQIGE